MPSSTYPPAPEWFEAAQRCGCGDCRVRISAWMTWNGPVVVEDGTPAVVEWRCRDCYDRRTDEPALTDRRNRQFCQRCTFECDGCNERRARYDGSRQGADGGTYCQRCVNRDGTSCTRCGTTYMGIEARTENMIQCVDGYRDWQCRDCIARTANGWYSNVWRQCSECANYFSRGLAHNDNTRCHDCGPDPVEGCVCTTCRYSGMPMGTIHDYGYKPRPRFHGTGRVYLGMELEIQTPDDEATPYLAGTAEGYLGTLGYLKNDSSIGEGFEMVTHPMTPDYALESFPWEMLNELESGGCDASDSCGIHVHVNRDGFDGASHVYKWLRLIYRNARDVQRIARRQSNEWASFDSWTTDAAGCKSVAKGQRGRERYVAVNATNDATFEVRAFASSLDPTEVRAALELVAGSVEYARQLTVGDVVKAQGWTWNAFIGWAEQQDGKYAALVAQNEERY